MTQYLILAGSGGVAKPEWVTTAGSLGTISDSGRTGNSFTVEASSQVTVTYSVTIGSLPTGMTLDGSTGVISGTPDAVGSDTTSTFTITATNLGGGADREFSITIKAPVITSYTATGGFTFNVPSGVTAVRVLVVGGGGGGGSVIAGGGGAGGLVQAPAYPVSPGGSVPGNVGGGGGGSGSRGSAGTTGQDSVFGQITSYGGGGGGSWQATGLPGGSGGGRTGGGQGFGTANQGSFPAVGATGYGNPGGQSPGGGNGTPGGGGGGAGGRASGGPTGYTNGGIGIQDDISGSSTYYAGGGGGGGYQSPNGSGGQGGGGPGGNPGTPATPNTGGGGGGSFYPPDPPGGSGGSGIVIVRY